MGADTKIEWCDHTFNPWRGCTKISEGCANCYAAGIANRNPGVLGQWGAKGTRVIAADDYWNEPLRWNHQAILQERRKRVFVASMADFHEESARWPRVDEARHATYHLITECQALDWLVLTKRPENVIPQWPDRWKRQTPENLWLGVTTENQRRYEKRSEILGQTYAQTRFLSIEPMLEAISLGWKHPGLTGGIDWVILGCESGARRRPMPLAWAETIIAECALCEVPVFVKQLPFDAVGCPDPVAGVCRHPDHWPAHLRVRRFPRSIVHRAHNTLCMCNQCTPDVHPAEEA